MANDEYYLSQTKKSLDWYYGRPIQILLMAKNDEKLCIVVPATSALNGSGHSHPEVLLHASDATDPIWILYNKVREMIGAVFRIKEGKDKQDVAYEVDPGKALEVKARVGTEVAEDSEKPIASASVSTTVPESKPVTGPDPTTARAKQPMKPALEENSATLHDVWPIIRQIAANVDDLGSGLRVDGEAMANIVGMEFADIPRISDQKGSEQGGYMAGNSSMAANAPPQGVVTTETANAAVNSMWPVLQNLARCVYKLANRTPTYVLSNDEIGALRAVGDMTFAKDTENQILEIGGGGEPRVGVNTASSASSESTEVPTPTSSTFPATTTYGNPQIPAVNTTTVGDQSSPYNSLDQNIERRRAKRRSLGKQNDTRKSSLLTPPPPTTSHPAGNRAKDDKPNPRPVGRRERSLYCPAADSESGGSGSGGIRNELREVVREEVATALESVVGVLRGG